MMKKLLALLLALMLCASLAACGGDDSSPDEGDSAGEPEVEDTTPDETEEPSGGEDAAVSVEVTGTAYTDYDLLSQVDAYHSFSPDELAGTTWSFSGGFSDGQDLDDEGAAAVLEMYSGTLQVEFTGEGNASFVQGGGSMPGVYTLLDDGITLNFAFELQGESYTYAAVFTTVGGEDDADPADAVMILVADAEPTIAFYMTPAA